MSFLSDLGELLGLDAESRAKRQEERTKRKAKKQEEKTERVEARAETRQARIEAGTDIGSILMKPLDVVENVATGAVSAVAENPELLAAGLAVAGGPAGAIGSTLLGALGGGGQQAQAAPVVVQDSAPTWLPWALGGLGLLAVGGIAVAAGRR